MSYSFHLNNAPKLKFSELLAESGINELQFIEGYPAPQNDFWPRGFTYIYQDKVTVRALEVDYDGDHFQVRVFTASSPEDYMLAIQLTSAVAKLCNARITPEDSETMDLASFTQQYTQDWANQFGVEAANRVLGMFGDSLEKGHQVSGVTGLLSIGPKVLQQIRKDPDKSAEAFFSRLKRLNYINDEAVVQAPLKIVHDESSDTNVRLSAYGEGAETLLCDYNTVVAVSTGERTMIKLSVADLAQVLGDRATWLSEELILLPELVSEQWQDFLTRAQLLELKDLTPYSFEPGNDPYQGKSFGGEDVLSEQEFNVLVYAPVAVFCLVAGADRKIDSKEINAFQQELVKGVSSESKTLQNVLMEAASDFQAMVKYLLSDEVDIDSILPRAVEILDSRLSAEEALHFKVSLLRIGTLVAEASGGVLGIFGDKVCKAERKVLTDMTNLFGLVE